MHLIRWIAGALTTLAAIIFAVANIRVVELVWSPLHAPAHMPLSLVCLLAFAIGFLAGGTIVWTRSLPVRLDLFRQKKKTTRLEEDLVMAERRAVSCPPPARNDGRQVMLP